MSRVYFITATGTDSGKTWLTAGVAAACRARGLPVRALKPVMSGYDPARPEANDAGVLAVALKVGPGDTVAAVTTIAPWRFAAPLSPDRAAALEGKGIDFAELTGWCRNEIAKDDGLLLIEGVGGVMVPLDATYTVRDWIAALDVPVVLVAGTYLGAISHTLSALAALRETGVVPALLVINQSAASTVSVEDTLASLRPHLGGLPLLTVGRDDAAGVAHLTDFLLGNET